MWAWHVGLSPHSTSTPNAPHKAINPRHGSNRAAVSKKARPGSCTAGAEHTWWQGPDDDVSRKSHAARQCTDGDVKRAHSVTGKTGRAAMARNVPSEREARLKLRAPSKQRAGSCPRLRPALHPTAPRAPKGTRAPARPSRARRWSQHPNVVAARAKWCGRRLLHTSAREPRGKAEPVQRA